VLTQALGTEEQRGRVRGMGKFVTPHQYFFLPKTVKQYLDNHNKKVNRRLKGLEDEIERLKRGTSVSEGASCQMWGNEDVEDEAPLVSLRYKCILLLNFCKSFIHN
jgi:hypothetical protein